MILKTSGETADKQDCFFLWKTNNTAVLTWNADCLLL